MTVVRYALSAVLAAAVLLAGAAHAEQRPLAPAPVELEVQEASTSIPAVYRKYARRYVPVPAGLVRSTRKRPVRTVDGRSVTLRRACIMHKARNIVVCPNGDVVQP